MRRTATTRRTSGRRPYKLEKKKYCPFCRKHTYTRRRSSDAVRRCRPTDPDADDLPKPPEWESAPKPEAVRREDQGRLARMAAFWSLALFLLFGCHSLSPGACSPRHAGDRDRRHLAARWSACRSRGAFLIAAAVFVAGLIADPPLAADAEDRRPPDRHGVRARKVAWPTLQQVLNASMVVIISVVLVLTASWR